MATIKLDCLYEACPMPLLKAMKYLKTMAAGDILIVETDHNCAIQNIQEWTSKKGLPCRVVEVGNGQWELYIEIV